MKFKCKKNTGKEGSFKETRRVGNIGNEVGEMGFTFSEKENAEFSRPPEKNTREFLFKKFSAFRKGTESGGKAKGLLFVRQRPGGPGDHWGLT